LKTVRPCFCPTSRTGGPVDCPFMVDFQSANPGTIVMPWCCDADYYSWSWSLSLFLHMSYWNYMYILYIYILYIYIHIYILYIHFYIHIDVLVYTCLIFKVTYHLWFSKIFLILHVLLTLQVPRSPAVFEAPSPRGCGKWCDSVIEEVSPRVIFFGLKPSIAIPYIHIIHVLVFFMHIQSYSYMDHVSIWHRNNQTIRLTSFCRSSKVQRSNDHSIGWNSFDRFKPATDLWSWFGFENHQKWTNIYYVFI
jgi:hypothetical protein